MALQWDVNNEDIEAALIAAGAQKQYIDREDFEGILKQLERSTPGGTDHDAIDLQDISEWINNAAGGMGGSIPAPAFDLPLQVGTPLSALTCTRASVGYARDTNDVYYSFPNDVPRVTDRGLLVEEGRINSIRNNSMQGAVAGTPGTLPTNWTASATPAGLTRTISPVGTENGIDYIDITYAGTAGATTNISIYLGESGPGPIAVTAGQLWTGSVFAKLVSGALPAGTVFSVLEWTGGLASSVAFNPGQTLARQALTRTIVGASDTLVIRCVIPFVNGQAYDFTLRIGWPQLELGSFVTSPIRTTSAAATRASETILVNNFGTWYDVLRGSVFVEAFLDRILPVNAFLWDISDGTINEEIFIFVNPSGPAFSASINDGGVPQLTGTFGGLPIVGQAFRAAVAFAENDFIFYANNGRIGLPDTSLTLPTPTQFRIGARGNSSFYYNGYIKRIAYWPKRLTNAELQGMTKAGNPLPEGATFSMDFTIRPSSKLTTTRASVGYSPDKAGKYWLFGANQPRLTDLGLLVEEARTNSIRNNSMQGAVVGTPGTLPTNWSESGDTGLVRTIVGVGTENGIDYIDVRYVGTTNATTRNLFFEVNNNIAASVGQTWAASVFVKLLAGSVANINQVFTAIQEYSAGAAFLTSGNNVFVPTVDFRRYSFARANTDATVAFVRQSLSMSFANGVAIDITLRIGWPQLELGSFVTSPIRTTSAAVARQVDLVTLADFASLGFNPVAGTLYGEGSAGNATAAQLPALASLDDGTANERWSIRRTNDAATGSSAIVDGGVVQASVAVSGWPINMTTHKVAVAAQLNDVAIAMDGSLGIPDNVATMPTPTRLVLGGGMSVHPLGGYLRRVAYWPKRLSNAELQVLTRS